MSLHSHHECNLQWRFPDVVCWAVFNVKWRRLGFRACQFCCLIKYTPMLSGSISPRHNASSGCGWRKQAPNMEGSCEFKLAELAVAHGQQGLVLQFGDWAGGNISLWRGPSYYMLHRASDFKRVLVNTVMNLLVSPKVGNFLTSWMAVSVSGRTLLLDMIHTLVLLLMCIAVVLICFKYRLLIVHELPTVNNFNLIRAVNKIYWTVSLV